MISITGTLHLWDGQEYSFTAEKDCIEFTWDITDEKADELFDDLSEIITLS